MSDNFASLSYRALMSGGQAHIIVTIDTKNPIEIGDFVAAFTSVANQYDKFIREHHPDVNSQAQIFVKEVTQGSIVADLIPFLPTMFGVDSVIHHIEQVNIVTEFVKLYGGKLGAYLSGGQDESSSSSDLKEFIGSVAAIANDPDGKAAIEAAYFEDGKKQITAAVRFDTKTATRGLQQIERRRLELERKSMPTILAPLWSSSSRM